MRFGIRSEAGCYRYISWDTQHRLKAVPLLSLMRLSGAYLYYYAAYHSTSVITKRATFCSCDKTSNVARVHRRKEDHYRDRSCAPCYTMAHRDTDHAVQADAEGERGSNEPRVNRVARLRVQYMMCHGKDTSAIFPVCRLYPFPTRKWPGATYPFGHLSSISMRNLHAAVLAE